MLACIFLQTELTAKARDSESPVQERFETTVLFVHLFRKLAAYKHKQIFHKLR